LITWILWRSGAPERPKPVGQITGEYLILTGIARFLVEFIRINPRILWGMTNAQLASLGAVVFGFGLILMARARAGAAGAKAERKTATAHS
jgi:phosphatidylglycerol:prolipoprotein diacylglycerol transferase